MKQKINFSKWVFWAVACLLQTHLMAEPVQPGTKVEVNADGSKSIQHTDGTSIEKNADGSMLIKKKDGTSIEIKPDGSKTIKRPDGTKIEVKPGQ